MSKRDLEQILQSFEEQIPEMIEKRIEETLQSLPEKKAGKPKRKWLRARWLALGTAAAVMAGIFFAGPTVSPAIGKAVQSIFSVADPGLQYVAKAGLSTQEEIVIEDKGIKLVIKEVFADKFRTSFVYYVEDAKGNWLDPNVAGIDGSYLSNALGFKIKSGGSDWRNLINSAGKPYAVYSINHFDGDVPETLYLHIDVENIHGTKGNWEKVIEINRTEMKKLVKTYKSDGSAYTLPNGVKIQVDRLELEPSTAKLLFKTTHFDPAEILFEITDENGKVVAHSLLQPRESLPRLNNDGGISVEPSGNGEDLTRYIFYGIAPAKRFDFHLYGMVNTILINKNVVVKNPKGTNTFAFGDDQLILRNFSVDQKGTHFIIEYISNDEVIGAFAHPKDLMTSESNAKTWKAPDGKYHYQAEILIQDKKLDLNKPISLHVSNINKIVRASWKVSLTPAKK